MDVEKHDDQPFAPLASKEVQGSNTNSANQFDCLGVMKINLGNRVRFFFFFKFFYLISKSTSNKGRY